MAEVLTWVLMTPVAMTTVAMTRAIRGDTGRTPTETDPASELTHGPDLTEEDRTTVMTEGQASTSVRRGMVTIVRPCTASLVRATPRLSMIAKRASPRRTEGRLGEMPSLRNPREVHMPDLLSLGLPLLHERRGLLRTAPPEVSSRFKSRRQVLPTHRSPKGPKKTSSRLARPQTCSMTTVSLRNLLLRQISNSRPSLPQSLSPQLTFSVPLCQPRPPRLPHSILLLVETLSPIPGLSSRIYSPLLSLRHNHSLPCNQRLNQIPSSNNSLVVLRLNHLNLLVRTSWVSPPLPPINSPHRPSRPLTMRLHCSSRHGRLHPIHCQLLLTNRKIRQCKMLLPILILLQQIL